MNTSLSLDNLSIEFEGKVYYEEWADVIAPIDFSDIYQVSSFGRIKKKKHQLKNGKWRDERIIKVAMNVKRYLRVALRFRGRKLGISLHRLVCLHFHPNPENKPQVNHKDNNKKNSYYFNLEWCTQPENIQHAQSLGIMPYAKPKIKVYKRKEEKKKPQPKKVINIETGEIFLSTQQVSDLTGLKFRSLRRALSGERYNKTPYRYFVKGQIINDVLLPPPPVVKIIPKIMFVKMDGEKVIEYVDFNAITDLKLKQKITAFSNGHQGSVTGFIYKKVADDGTFIEPIKFISKKKIIIRGEPTPKKPIIQLTKTGDEIFCYPSLSDAAKAFGTNRRNFSKAIIKSPNRYYKGYIWKYA